MLMQKTFDINDASAPDKINAWIEDNTNGLIKKMIDKLNDNTVMLLINAIYFKGKWKSQFEESKTIQMPFYQISRQSDQCADDEAENRLQRV